MREKSSRQRPRDWTVMAAAAGGRIALGLLFAPFVMVALPSDEATRMYQLLFLQGGLTALLSASAYARGAQLAASGAPIWRSTHRFLGFLALAGLSALAVGAVLLPVPGGTRIVEICIVSLLVGGAASTALNGFLQGVTVVRRGGAAAFLPSLSVAMAGCAILLALWGPRSALAVALAWTVPQVLTPAALLVAVPEVRRYFRRQHTGKVPETSQFAATGLANAGTVGVGYAYRERWAAAQSPTDAATGFLVVRLSELVYQVLYMATASLPGTLDRLFGRRLRSARGQLSLLVACVAVVIPGFVPAAVWDEWTLSRFVTAELLVAPARVLAMLCLLTLLARRTTRAYQVALVVGIAASAALMAYSPIQTSAYGLQAFYAANAAAALLITVVAHRVAVDRSHRPTSRPADHPDPADVDHGS